MRLKSNNEVSDLKSRAENLKADITTTESELCNVQDSINAQRQELCDLASRMQQFTDLIEIDIPMLGRFDIRGFVKLNDVLDSALQEKAEKPAALPKLSTVDIAISSLAGIIAIVIDAFLVGTPEVVKIYKGGERFDGSLLTAAIRKFGDGPLKGFTDRLSEVCKVPYDISAIKDGMYPQNHRLRSLSHDPLLGLFFSVFDIIMNTTTFVDNAGYLRIVPNDGFSRSKTEMAFPVVYYLGHIISDLFTARGIPIPGFFLTQFFTGGDSSDSSIAGIAEEMYLDGYDMRHLASMSMPVAAKNIIIDAYLKLSEPAMITSHLPLWEREKLEMDDALKREKMNFIANSVAVSGNTVKFFANYSNPASLNAPEWLAFLRSSIVMAKAFARDLSTEEVIRNRQDINSVWDEL